ncbi:MAG: protein kinase [Eubacterium sp.]|nr:protein kinase [Eubacterium sp.]
MYEIISTISESEKSAVYLAAVPEYEEPVIVKVLENGNEDVIRRIAELDVPQIPKILNWETDGDRLTVYEQYIDGETIDVFVEKNHSTEDEIVAFIIQICDGLEVLHRLDPPIIHRDLKPSNILVTRNDELRQRMMTNSSPDYNYDSLNPGTDDSADMPEAKVSIIDFDASREYKSEQTRDTQILGTASYAPPEQYGYSQTDIRSDIYSLGVVLHELLPEPVHPKLSHIIERCMMFNPDARYSDVFSLKKALLSYKKSSRKGIIITIAAILAACAIGLGFFLYFKPASESSEVRESYIDTLDWKTGTSVTWTCYYWLEHPELTPIHITSSPVQGLTAREIQIRGPVSKYTDTLDADSWEQDEYGYVNLKDSFLQSLEEDATYTLTIDYTSYHLSFNLCCIRDLGKVRHAEAVITPGFYEYLRTDPGDKSFYAQNTFGRKLIKLTDMETGNDLDRALYSYDESSNMVTFSEKMFEAVPDGEYLNYYLIFDSLSEIEDPPDENRPTITFCVRNRAYIRPEFEKQNYILTSGSADDLEIEFEWNDGKGKLEFITLAQTDASGETDDGDSGMIDEKYYDITEDGIIVRGEYLKTLKQGDYTMLIEFGDVAQPINIAIVG